MELEELKRIAEARTKGKWTDTPYSWIQREDGSPFFEIDSAHLGDRKFICMAANHFDALLDVVEAAKTVVNGRMFANDLMKIEKSIKKLEQI